MNCPAEWVEDIGKLLKQLTPKTLFVDGIYGVNPTHLSIKEVDVFSNHYYPVEIKKLQDDLELVESSRRI